MGEGALRERPQGGLRGSQRTDLGSLETGARYRRPGAAREGSRSAQARAESPLRQDRRRPRRAITPAEKRSLGGDERGASERTPRSSHGAARGIYRADQAAPFYDADRRASTSASRPKCTARSWCYLLRSGRRFADFGERLTPSAGWTDISRGTQRFPLALQSVRHVLSLK